MKDTRNEILKKSLSLFMQKSYKEVTMQDIVNAVGFTKGAFYHHFRSKDEVYEECVKHFYNEIMISDYTSFPTTSLKDFYNYYLGELDKNKQDETNSATRFIFMLESSLKIPSLVEIHEKHQQKEVDEWTVIVDHAKTSKEISSPIESREIAEMFLKSGDGVVLNNLFTGKPYQTVIDETKKCWDNLYITFGGK